MRQIAQLVLGTTLSAVLFVLALPPADHGWLGWVCFAPLLAAIRGRGVAVAVACAFATSLLAAYVTTVGWFYASPRLSDDSGWHYAAFAMFGVALAVVAALVGEKHASRPGRLIVVAACAVLVEAALQIYLPGHLGLALYRSKAALTLASWTGVWGVSYLLWLGNLAAAEALAPPRPRLAWVAPLPLLLVMFQIKARNHLPPGSIQVAALQTTSTEAKDLAEMNLEAGRQGARLVVWPELSGNAFAPGGDTSGLRKVAASPGQPPFATTYSDNARPLPHNAMALFTRAGESEHYWKRKPFGGERTMHAAGSQARAVEWQGMEIGLAVCFDSCFPNVMRDTARLDGVQLVLVPSMGPESPYAVLQALHGAFTTFRAAEMGIPIVRSDVSGYSMIVDEFGAILKEAPAGFSGPLVGRVGPANVPTLYRAWGDWFLWVCGGIASLGIWWGLRHRRQGQPKDAQSQGDPTP